MHENYAFQNALVRGSTQAHQRADSTVTISMKEASDLLRGFQAENAPLQAILTSPCGPGSLLRGRLRPSLDGRFWCVRSELETTGSALSFDLFATTQRRFGDMVSMPADAAFPFRLRYESAIRFDFEDGSRLILFGLEDTMQDSIEELGL
jgi:hypothetical protein